MGPQPDALNEVKKDAIRTTLRHFRDEAEDESSTFQGTAKDIDKVRDQLLKEQDEELVNPQAETVESKPADKSAPKETK